MAVDTVAREAPVVAEQDQIVRERLRMWHAFAQVTKWVVVSVLVVLILMALFLV